MDPCITRAAKNPIKFKYPIILVVEVLNLFFIKVPRLLNIALERLATSPKI